MSAPPVRLSPEELRAIRTTAERIFGATALREIFIFGSRADLNRRGGDIDLWIELETSPMDAARLARDFRLGLPPDWETQKVDLKVTGPLSQLDAATQIFLNVVKSSMIPLWSNRNSPLT